jgi:putative SOS response-associated peptidase YedK
MEKSLDPIPVILNKRNERVWLSPDTAVVEAQRLLKSCPSTWLAAREVSMAANSPRNNRKEILEHVK